MKHYKIFFIVFLLLQLASCGKDVKKNKKKEPKAATIATQSVIQKKSVIDTLTIKNTLSKIRKKTTTAIKKNNATGIIKPEAHNTKTALNESKKSEYRAYANFKKIFSLCKIGQTISQNELTKIYNMPEEGVKLIKSIVKISENEIAIKWKSTWMIEKISDAKFKDSTLKFKFEKDQILTSGNAIGIKYGKKIYTDLIIKGNKAFIPTVKGYSWQIGI